MRAEAKVQTERGVKARMLNESCHCVSVDRQRLEASLERAAGEPSFFADLLTTRPHLFANAPVFLRTPDVEAMVATVRAIETTVRLPRFVEAALASAPPIARTDHGPAGAFMSYDFHLTAEGPKLIEINTNAGGAFLNAFLARAQRLCCASIAPSYPETFDAAVVDMFIEEWRRQRGEGRPALIAIVDDAPAQQYLYPEFILAHRLLTGAGFEVVVADAGELRYEGRALRHGGRAIDLVYNRLVDFTLSDAAHAPIREAYDVGAVVVTPNPFVHALFADKRNLVRLSNADQLAKWGLSAHQVAQLSALPRAVEVTVANADVLWADRSRYFFKPAGGYGGKAVYRGDKVTKRAWEIVRKGNYIAQERAEPSERVVRIDEEDRACKVDVRLYTYRGQLLLAAARLYQGQTTNFRTPGGGFAPVLLV
jgi:hypothetical protein